jgi:ADP-dependent phosphofructokinase/glucokinase
VTNRKNGRILFDRPKPTVGCSASGRRRRNIYIISDGRNESYQVIPIPTWILDVPGFNLGLGTTVGDSGFSWSF